MPRPRKIFGTNRSPKQANCFPFRSPRSLPELLTPSESLFREKYDPHFDGQWLHRTSHRMQYIAWSH